MIDHSCEYNISDQSYDWGVKECAWRWDGDDDDDNDDEDEQHLGSMSVLLTAAVGVERQHWKIIMIINATKQVIIYLCWTYT